MEFSFDQLFLWLGAQILGFAVACADAVWRFLFSQPMSEETRRLAVSIFCMLLVALTIYGAFANGFGMLTWLERKILARIQNRYGPNRVGPFGFFQWLADGLKLLMKEDIVPERADRLVHLLAPVLITIPAVLMYAFIPFGRNMTPVELDTAVIGFFAVGAASELIVFMAGWAGRNKYSVLGAMRAVAQMISYEVPLVFAAVPVVMICGTLHTTEIVRHQSSGGFFDISRWFVWTPWGFSGFILYVIALVAESNRSPFDIPEGESEIVAGFHTEYTGMKFAMFFLGEYLGMIAMAALGATLFLGGWNGPRLLPSWVWFCLKTFAIICALIWFRGTFPRLRVDQLMSFAWKALLPFALLNIVAAAVWFYVPKTSFALGVVAWFASAAVVVIAYAIISRVLAARVLERRVYRFAS